MLLKAFSRDKLELKLCIKNWLDHNSLKKLLIMFIDGKILILKKKKGLFHPDTSLF
jgi:hypothetical protein